MNMNLEQAFYKLLYTRGALIKQGRDKGTVGSWKSRIKNEGKYPLKSTMVKCLLDGGYSSLGTTWSDTNLHQ